MEASEAFSLHRPDFRLVDGFASIQEYEEEWYEEEQDEEQTNEKAI